MDAAALQKLETEGTIPPMVKIHRAVGGKSPTPLLGHTIVTEDFVQCGFLTPPSEFISLILNFYGIHLLHLNPNSVAFLSIFATYVSHS